MSKVTKEKKISKKAKIVETKTKKKDEKIKKSESINKDDFEKDEDIEEDEGIEDDEEIFFNENTYKNFIEKNNIAVLNEEIYTNNDLHKVNIITPASKRITSEIMTLAEYTRVISERAKQIENGSTIFIDYGEETEPKNIAMMEIVQKMSPIQIIRHITKNIIEIWEVNEMIIPFR